MKMSKEVISKPLPDINEATKWRFWGKVQLQANPYKCWEYQGYRHRGYGKFCITVSPNKDKPVIAPRLAYFLHHGIDPVGKAVLHKCDNPSCCNPHHLFLGTNKENTADMFKKKRANPPKGDEHWRCRLSDKELRERNKLNPYKGSKVNTAKLIESDVIDMRQMHKSGIDILKIHEKYSKVSLTTVKRIINRHAWKHC